MHMKITDDMGPLSCVEIALGNAGIELSGADTVLLAEALVNIGANFDA